MCWDASKTFVTEGVYQLDSGQNRDFEHADGAETAVRGWVGRLRTEAFGGWRKHSNFEELDATGTVAATNGDAIGVRFHESGCVGRQFRCATG